MRDYDDVTLKKLQNCELGILRDFVKVCEENNFTYFGMSGTGIGDLGDIALLPVTNRDQREVTAVSFPGMMTSILPSSVRTMKSWLRFSNVTMPINTTYSTPKQTAITR